MKKGLTYDDVLLIPQKSPVRSRRDTDISVELNGGLSLDVPVFSSSMDTVTDGEMAQAMSNSGGAGIVHRFCTIDEQAAMVRFVDGIVGAAIGVSKSDYEERLPKLVDSGVDFICVDVAHGHTDSSVKQVRRVSSMYPKLPLMAGAVATYRGTKDLARSGADMIRVGVGPGSSCLTREAAGVGVPQISAIQDCSRYSDVSIVSDGGVKKPGDVVKALMAGADAVVVGGLLGACEESPAPIVTDGSDEYKEIRGMASRAAQEDHKEIEEVFVEGDSYNIPLYGTVEERMESFEKGIRSGLSYCGAYNIENARDNAEFIEVTPNTVRRNGIHGPSGG